MSSFISLRSQLSGRCKDSRKIGNNTYIVNRDYHRWTDDGNTHTTIQGVALRYHRTDLITFIEDGRIILDNGDYRTTTTSQRFRQYMPDGFYMSGWKVYKDSLPWINPDSIGVDFQRGMDLSKWDQLVEDQIALNRHNAQVHAEEVKMNRAHGAKRAVQTKWLRKNYPWAEDYADELTEITRAAIMAVNPNRYGHWVRRATIDDLGRYLYEINHDRLVAEEQARREQAEDEADVAFEAEERRIMEEADRINRLRYQANLAAFNTGVTQ